jgi:transcriptional regulator with XRE-family HTH domain
LKNDENRRKELAHFLKTRREKILPSQVGITTTARRRTPGLRREEVAQLAGVSITWYTWLEQGREIRVSAQVIESISRVLLLDRQERNHLFLLANQILPVDFPEYQGTVSLTIQHVLDSLSYCPTIIVDQRFNVIAWNKAACAILGDFSKMNIRQRNVVWAMFTEERFKQLYVDWHLHAQSLVGNFRSTCGKYIEDPWLNQFVNELKMQSVEFDAFWSLHEIKNNNEVYKQLNHPIVGSLDFEVCNFEVLNSAALKMIVHTPLSTTNTADKMRLLIESEMALISK